MALIGELNSTKYSSSMSKYNCCAALAPLLVVHNITYEKLYCDVIGDVVNLCGIPSLY
jgi:hypothetical protein